MLHMLASCRRRLVSLSAALIAASALAIAQSATEPPIGIVRGELTAQADQILSMKLADGREVKCTFNAKSWFERDSQRIEPGALRSGDRLEVVTDRRDGVCFARTVHVIDSTPVKVIPGRRPPLKRQYSSPTEAFAPRGDMEFTGIVTSLTEEWLTIRTRSQGNRSFLLRNDTRYMSDGLRQERAMLNMGLRVFVRAGRNFEGQVEAYQVVWGDILKP